MELIKAISPCRPFPTNKHNFVNKFTLHQYRRLKFSTFHAEKFIFLNKKHFNFFSNKKLPHNQHYHFLLYPIYTHIYLALNSHACARNNRARITATATTLHAFCYI